MRSLEINANTIVAPEELETVIDRVDAIATVTYSCNADYLDENGEPIVRLSALSRAAIDATVLVASEHDRPIRIAGEHSFGFKSPSTAELMIERINGIGLQTENLESTGVNLVHTARQVEKHSRRAADSSNLVAFVGMEFHLERIALHAQAFGLSMLCIDVREILEHHNKLDLYPEIDHIRPIADRERHIRMLTKFIDRKGIILDAISSLQGPRLHDVILNESGEYEAILSTTRSRLKELHRLADETSL